MKRVALAVALLLLFPTVSAAQENESTSNYSRRRDPRIELPPATLSPALALAKYQEHQRVWVPRKPGVAERWPGLVVYNVPGQYVGGYVWDEREMEYVEMTVPYELFVGPVTGHAGSPWEDPTLAEMIELLEGVQRNEALWRQAIERGRKRATATTQGESNVSSPQVPALETRAPYGAPVSMAPAPTPAPVVTTVYREVQVPAPSRLSDIVESRLGWLVLGVLVIGIMAGFATRGSGSRQIVISSEEHARAAAELEQRLRADALRMKRLSNAVDQEEARYIQRVSAITRRG